MYRQIEKKAGKGATTSSTSAEASASTSSSQLAVSSADYGFDPLAQGVSPYSPHYLAQPQSNSRPESALESPNSPYLSDMPLVGGSDLARAPSASQVQSRLHAAGRLRSVSSASDTISANQRRKPYPLSDPRIGAGGQPQLLSSSATEESSPLARSAHRSTSGGGNRESDIERALVGSLKSSYPFAKDGLCKKTISIQVHGSTQHLISYYKVEDVRSGRLRTPLSLPEISGLDISPMILQKSNFRNPPDIEVLPDGTLRYRGDGSESSRRAGGTGSGSEGTSGSEGVSGQHFYNAATQLSPTGMHDVFGQANPFESRHMVPDGTGRTAERRASDPFYAHMLHPNGATKAGQGFRGDPYSSTPASYSGSGTAGGISALGLDNMNGPRAFEASSVGGLPGAAHGGRGRADTSTLPAGSYWQQQQPAAEIIPPRSSASPHLTVDTSMGGRSGLGKLQRLNSGKFDGGLSAEQSALGLQPQQAVYLQQAMSWPKSEQASSRSWTPSGGVAVSNAMASSEGLGHIKSDEGGWHQEHQQPPHASFSLGAHEAPGSIRYLDSSDTSGDLSHSPHGHFDNGAYQHQHLHQHQLVQGQDFPTDSPLVRAMQQQALHDPSAVAFDMAAVRAGAMSRGDDASGSQAGSWQPESVLGQQLHRGVSARHGGEATAPSSSAAAFEVGIPHQRQWQEGAANHSNSAVGEFGSFGFEPSHAQQEQHQSGRGHYQHHPRDGQHHLGHSTASWARQQELERQQERIRLQQQQQSERQQQGAEIYRQRLFPPAAEAGIPLVLGMGSSDSRSPNALSYH